MSAPPLSSEPPPCCSTSVVLPFAECLLSVLLFALSTGLVQGMNSIVTVISSKLSRPKEEPRVAKLDDQICEIRQQMALLSPTSDFAQYFKLERTASKLADERKKIVSSRKVRPMHSQTFAMCLRAMTLFISFALALHSAPDTRLFALSIDHFYPFNFVLNFPSSIVNIYQWTSSPTADSSRQPVGLFALSILSLFTLKIWNNSRTEMSKKIE